MSFESEQLGWNRAENQVNQKQHNHDRAQPLLAFTSHIVLHYSKQNKQINTLIFPRSPQMVKKALIAFCHFGLFNLYT